jgi:hypothetical protein
VPGVKINNDDDDVVSRGRDLSVAENRIIVRAIKPKVIIQVEGTIFFSDSV